MSLRQALSQQTAAAWAGFSASIGSRLQADPRLPSKASPRSRRRPDPLAMIWDTEIVPMLTAMPGLRPITLFDEMLRRHPALLNLLAWPGHLTRIYLLARGAVPARGS